MVDIYLSGMYYYPKLTNQAHPMELSLSLGKLGEYPVNVEVDSQGTIESAEVYFDGAEKGRCKNPRRKEPLPIISQREYQNV